MREPAVVVHPQASTSQATESGHHFAVWALSHQEAKERMVHGNGGAPSKRYGIYSIKNMKRLPHLLLSRAAVSL